MLIITVALNRYRAAAERWERQHGNDPQRGFSPQNPHLADLLAAQSVARMHRGAHR